MPVFLQPSFFTYEHAICLTRKLSAANYLRTGRTEGFYLRRGETVESISLFTIKMQTQEVTQTAEVYPITVEDETDVDHLEDSFQV